MKKNNIGILLWILLVDFNLLCSGQKFLNTGLYQRHHTDGPGGKCKLLPYKSGIPLSNSEIQCESGWVKNKTRSTRKLYIPNKRRCRYFKKTVTYFCYDTPQGRNGPATCIRNNVAYNMISTCSEYWLNWEKCDKRCGGGMKTRVRITKADNNIYRINTDYRTCNVHACPRWSEWEPKNVNESCDPETCTRLWKRDCVFNNTVADPSLCNDGKIRGNVGNDNLTHEIRSCFLYECVAPTTTPNTTFTTDTTSGKSPTLSTQTTTEIFTTGSLFQESFRDVEKVRTQDDNIWLGIGIGFLIALCVFLLGCGVVYHSRKRIKGCVGAKLTNVNEAYNRNNHTSNRDSSPALITPMGSNEDIAHIPSNGSMYCNVPSKASEISLQPQEQLVCNAGTSIVQHDSHPQNSSVVGFANASNVKENSERARLSRVIENAGSEVYSTSEFDTGSDNDSEASVNEDVCVVANTHSKYGGCKSFESDEDRDVVHTLRKPIEKLRSKQLGNKGITDDVFKSVDEENSLHEDQDNESFSAYVARYSKLAPKRLKNQLTHTAGRCNKSAESEFQWSAGKAHTSLTSETSLCAQEELPEEEPMTEEVKGHQKLSCRHSSGGSSIISCNIDGVTSGYNSALGDSTDDDRSIRNKKPRSRQRRSTLRSTFSYQSRTRRQAQQKWKMSSLRNNYATTERQHSNNMCPRTANSLFNPKISQVPVGERQRTMTMQKQTSDPWSEMYPGVSHSFASLPGRGRRTQRDITIEDVYSFPADAKSSVFKEDIYAKYNVPFDAIQR